MAKDLNIRDIINIIENKSEIIIYSGALAIFRLKHGEKEAINLPLFEWENPLSPLVSFMKEQLHGRTIILSGKTFSIEQIERYYVENELDSYKISLRAKNEVAELSWDGRVIHIYSILRAVDRKLKRILRLYDTISNQFYLAKILKQSGKPELGGKYVVVSEYSFPYDSPTDILDIQKITLLDMSILRKLIHPIHVYTDNYTTIHKLLKELSNKELAYSRLTIYVYYIVRLAMSILENISNISWSDLSVDARKDILKRIADLYWLEKPILRTDPLCPPKDKFRELVLKVGIHHSDLVSKENINAVINMLKENIDISELIISLKSISKST